MKRDQEGIGMFDLGMTNVGDHDVVAEIIGTLRAAGEAVGRSSPGVLAMFRPGDHTTLFDYLETHLVGLDRLAATTRDLTKARFASVTYPVVSVQQLSPTTALSLSLSVVDIELDDGTRIYLHARVTDVWQLVDDTWLAVHEHASVPIDVKTGAGILDAPLPHHASLPHP